MTENTLCLILGGGQGKRLFPLTKERSKPAVPIGGKFRLIDIPISNSLNSKIYKIFILTQFNSASLNQHINQTYRFDGFHDGFVDLLAAEQTMENAGWYQGTADAVRKNIKHFTSFKKVKYILILSGDQIYSMDFNQMFSHHQETQAEVTVSVLPCDRNDARNFGIVGLEKGMIKRFVEKPQDDDLLESFRCEGFIKRTFPYIEKNKSWLASMGIYLFNLDTLLRLLDNDFKDFGKEVIPSAIRSCQVGGYLFNGYWEDVGTIRSFWAANLDFASCRSQFDFCHRQIYTQSRHLPSSHFNACRIDESLICEGSILDGVILQQSVIGIRSILRKGCIIEESIVMGSDDFENENDLIQNRRQGIPRIGLGENCTVKNAIIDKNARIGNNCQIYNQSHIDHFDGENYYIRDGIVIIPKNAVIKDDTVI